MANKEIPIDDIPDAKMTTPLAESDQVMEKVFEKASNPMLQEILNCLPEDTRNFNREFISGAVNDRATDETPIMDNDEEESYSPFICANCNSLNKKLLFCMNCSMVGYCSKECSAKHWEEKHKYECYCMSLIRPNDGDRMEADLNSQPIMGKRLIAKVDIKAGEFVFKEKPLVFVVNYDDNELKDLSDSQRMIIFGSPNAESKRHLWFNDESLFNFNKESDISIHRLTKLKAKVVDAILVHHPNMLGTKFFNIAISANDPIFDNRAIELLHAHHLLLATAKGERGPDIKDVSHIWGIVSQNHMVAQPLFSHLQLGMGLFPKFALLNHSCNANMIYFYTYGEMICFATRDIPKGEELTIDYLGGVSSFAFRPLRKINLKNMSRFDCKCVECSRSEDFIKSEWHITNHGIRNIKGDIEKLTVLMFQGKYVDAIKNICSLWRDNKENMSKALCLVIELASMLISAHVMTTYTGNSSDEDTLKRLEIVKLSDELIKYAISVTTKSAFNPENSETSRNLTQIRFKLHVGHIIVCLKDIFVAFTINGERDKAIAFFNKEKEYDTPKGKKRATMSRMVYNNIRDDIKFIGDHNKITTMLNLDLPVNTLLAHLPEFLNLLDDVVVKPILLSRNST